MELVQHQNYHSTSSMHAGSYVVTSEFKFIGKLCITNSYVTTRLGNCWVPVLQSLVRNTGSSRYLGMWYSSTVGALIRLLSSDSLFSKIPPRDRMYSTDPTFHNNWLYSVPMEQNCQNLPYKFSHTSFLKRTDPGSKGLKSGWKVLFSDIK